MVLNLSKPFLFLKYSNTFSSKTKKYFYACVLHTFWETYLNPILITCSHISSNINSEHKNLFFSEAADV